MDSNNTIIDYSFLSGADLAFVGDACYGLYIREYVVKKGITKLYELHNECINYVNKEGQSKIITELIPKLTEKELAIYKRGRNHKYKDKSKEYIEASGFEALIGYLYLTKQQDRLDEVISQSIQIIEKKD